MKNIKLFLLLFISLAYGSCQNGLVLEIDIPEHEPALVPYCFINAEDSIIKVFVQQSQGILDSSQLRFIDNATVELYKNGVLWQNLTTKITNPATGELYYQAVLNQSIAASEGYGDSYELRVSAPNFETVTATQTLPAPKLVTEIQHLRRAANSIDQVVDNTRVTIEDTPNEENYYRIILDVHEIGTAADGDTVYEARAFGGETLSNTESISNGFLGVVITDKLFDGLRFTADVGSSPWGSSYSNEKPNNSFGTIEVTLLTITRAEYLYQKSLYAYSRALGNPFSEPTLIYGNFSGGLGIFSMMSATKNDFVF